MLCFFCWNGAVNTNVCQVILVNIINFLGPDHGLQGTTSTSLLSSTVAESKCIISLQSTRRSLARLGKQHARNTRSAAFGGKSERNSIFVCKASDDHTIVSQAVICLAKQK
jgi:hypothetical protein